jgi:hypothetical protein
MAAATRAVSMAATAKAARETLERAAKEAADSHRGPLQPTMPNQERAADNEQPPRSTWEEQQ